MPVACVGFEDSDAGLTSAIPVTGDGEHRVAAVAGYTGVDRAAIKYPVAIGIQKPLAGTGTEYADLGSQRILAIKRRCTVSAHTHAYIDCCTAGTAAGTRPADNRGVCRRGSGSATVAPLV